MEKKKVGRPKKVVAPTPKKTVKNIAFYKKALADLHKSKNILQKDKDTMQRQYETHIQKINLYRDKDVEVINDLNQQIDKAVQKRGFWIQKTEEAQKKNEALFSLVKELVDTAVNDLVHVEVTTGKITALDVIYHVSMIERVMEAKFNPETEE